MRLKNQIMTIDGMPVYNAKKPLYIHITKHDVKIGKKKSPAECAAAISAKREMKADEVRVHLGRTYVRKGKEWQRYLTPGSLRSEIISFDRGGTFSPGDYKLGAMTPSHIDDVSRGKASKKPKKQRGPYHFFYGVRAKAERHFEQSRVNK